MTGSSSFASYAQNGEDVVLWRALRGIENGRYIDVGANDPAVFSVSMAFYAHGWSGITVEPDPQFAQLQREQRPRDLAVEAAITAKDGDTVTLHVVDGTGLSTLVDSYRERHARSGFETHDLVVGTRRLDAILDEARWAGKDIHFMSVDVEGAEREVLQSIDFSLWRPWILVIEATAPLSTDSTRGEWESIVLDAGYRFCLFDGLSCFYVASERSDQLGRALSYPACVFDDFTTAPMRECRERADAAQQSADRLLGEVVRWRGQAVSRWASAVTAAEWRAKQEATAAELARLQAEHHELSEMHHATVEQINALYASTSWRITKPMRKVVTKLTSRGRG